MLFITGRTLAEKVVSWRAHWSYHGLGIIGVEDISLYSSARICSLSDNISD